MYDRAVIEKTEIDFRFEFLIKVLVSVNVVTTLRWIDDFFLKGKLLPDCNYCYLKCYFINVYLLTII